MFIFNGSDTFSGHWVLFLDESLMALLTGTYIPMYLMFSARHSQDSFKVNTPSCSFQLTSDRAWFGLSRLVICGFKKVVFSKCIVCYIDKTIKNKAKSCSMTAQETRSELQKESDNGVYSHQPLRTSLKRSESLVISPLWVRA